MLAKLLQSVSTDDEFSEGIAQLIVTALGTNGRHYLCWKTHAEEYKQHRYGLPDELDRWLFPKDGSTRDFETLQVILSSEDGFRASDKNGQVRSLVPESSRVLQRATTLANTTTESASRRRWSAVRELAREPERRRSLTWSSTRRAEQNPSSSSNIIAAKSQMDHVRSSSAESLSTASLMTRKRGPLITPRPPSWRELEVLGERDGPRSPRESLQDTAYARNDVARHCTCGCHAENGRTAFRRSWSKKSSDNLRAQRYVDAGMQTEPPPSQRYSSATTVVDDNDLHREQLESAVKSIGVIERIPSGEEKHPIEMVRNQMSSVLYEPQEYLPNPIVMGRMQEYFRASTYILGDALGQRA